MEDTHVANVPTAREIVQGNPDKDAGACGDTLVKALSGLPSARNAASQRSTEQHALDDASVHSQVPSSRHVRFDSLEGGSPPSDGSLASMSALVRSSGALMTHQHDSSRDPPAGTQPQQPSKALASDSGLQPHDNGLMRSSGAVRTDAASGDASVGHRRAQQREGKRGCGELDVWNEDVHGNGHRLAGGLWTLFGTRI